MGNFQYQNFNTRKLGEISVCYLKHQNFTKFPGIDLRKRTASLLWKLCVSIKFTLQEVRGNLVFYAVEFLIKSIYRFENDPSFPVIVDILKTRKIISGVSKKWQTLVKNSMKVILEITA